MNLLLRLLFQVVCLYETLAWEVLMPKEIHGLRGSCLVVPCSFSYSSYPPSNPHRVVWYQWASFGYPLVYDPSYKGKVIDKFRGKTELYGDPSHWGCSLLIKDLQQSHHGEKLYTWIDPDNIGWTTYKFYDVTSTIRVDTEVKQPNISIYGGERIGSSITVECSSFHTCPYRKPTFILKGVEGSDKTDDVHIRNGLWRSSVRRTGVVKAERSDIECTVRHYGGISATAATNKNAACVHNKITIEPEAADVTEGVAQKFVCTIHHSCLKNPPTISWNYKNMQVSAGTEKLTGSDMSSFSTIIFIAARKDNGRKLTCTAELSGINIKKSVDLRVQQFGIVPVNPNIKDDHVYEAAVFPRLAADPHSCVVIPCSFKMEEEWAVKLSFRWITEKGYMFHTGQSKVSDNFKGRTRLLGNLDKQNCSVEIDDVQNHDNGPFCFQAEQNEKKYFFNNSCVFILMQAAPNKPVMSSLPELIEPGTRVTVSCSVNHTCPSHPPSITWNVPPSREIVSHRSMGRGVWETVSTMIFIPTGYEEQDKIDCRVKLWGRETPETISSTELSVRKIQGVGLETLGPYVIAPALVFLLLCAGGIIYRRRRRALRSQSDGPELFNNRDFSDHSGRAAWTKSFNRVRFNNMS